MLTYGAALGAGKARSRGTLIGVLAMLAGSGSAQEAFATAAAGPKFDPATDKRVKQSDGSVAVRPKTPGELYHAGELQRAKDRRNRAAAMRASVAAQDGGDAVGRLRALLTPE